MVSQSGTTERFRADPSVLLGLTSSASGEQLVYCKCYFLFLFIVKVLHELEKTGSAAAASKVVNAINDSKAAKQRS